MAEQSSEQNKHTIKTKKYYLKKDLIFKLKLVMAFFNS